MVSRNLHDPKDGNNTAPAPPNDTAMTENDVTFVNKRAASETMADLLLITKVTNVVSPTGETSLNAGDFLNLQFLT